MFEVVTAVATQKKRWTPRACRTRWCPVQQGLLWNQDSKSQGMCFLGDFAYRSWGKANNKLVGGFNHLEKNISQWDGLSHILWKIKND